MDELEEVVAGGHASSFSGAHVVDELAGCEVHDLAEHLEHGHLGLEHKTGHLWII